MDEHVKKLQLMAAEGVRGVGEYIFLHPHFEQNQDQTHSVCLEAMKKNSMNKYISSRNPFQKIK